MFGPGGVEGILQLAPYPSWHGSACALCALLLNPPTQMLSKTWSFFLPHDVSDTNYVYLSFSLCVSAIALRGLIVDVISEFGAACLMLGWCCYELWILIDSTERN